MSAVTDAIEALRQAMLDEGQDPGAVEAKLKMAKPREVNMVGNYADLQRSGEATTEVNDEAGEVGYDSMTKAELQAELEAQGIEYSASDTKADLVAALRG